MSHTEDKLAAIPQHAADVHTELRVKHDRRGEERAQAELARGCACGKQWSEHYWRGRWVACKASP